MFVIVLWLFHVYFCFMFVIVSCYLLFHVYYCFMFVIVSCYLLFHVYYGLSRDYRCTFAVEHSASNVCFNCMHGPFYIKIINKKISNLTMNLRYMKRLFLMLSTWFGFSVTALRFN